MIRHIAAALGFLAAATAAPAAEIDNSSIGQAEFRPHTATYGLVYVLPKDANDRLDAKIRGPLKDRLVALGLSAEAELKNIPHITVVHIHNADPATPAAMLKALPKPPAPLAITMKKFYTTEAAKGAGRPWWLDLGVVKEGKGYDDMMAYNVVATAALAPLRDGPLPRVTGPVYAAMGDAGKELVKTVGVSGVNVMKDGKATTSHNPHNTLVYSMEPFAKFQAPMDALAAEFNTVLPDGFPVTLKTVSIVELQFSGNVVREIYRISLEDGSVTDVATGKSASAR
ncbi:hypothetical protein [Methylopila sp. Yamaguchi]|uniref:hypothetical protein n=1 Tax=Methylopila sp. Yamaguchi TaxID=1437817 RepID=UPI000CC5CA90|nr:hypothetical protein [Methylopila sp. Yamaguchi]GBD49522.1 hypothetical protein METY_2735 [Methylopila sp. Yamaguchi]